MRQTSLVLIIIGVIIFGISFVFMMPWDLYIKPVFWQLWIVGIIFVAIGLHLDNKEKKIT